MRGLSQVLGGAEHICAGSSTTRLGPHCAEPRNRGPDHVSTDLAEPHEVMCAHASLVNRRKSLHVRMSSKVDRVRPKICSRQSRRISQTESLHQWKRSTKSADPGSSFETYPTNFESPSHGRFRPRDGRKTWDETAPHRDKMTYADSDRATECRPLAQPNAHEHPYEQRDRIAIGYIDVHNAAPERRVTT